MTHRARFTEDEYKRLVKAMAEAMMSLNVLEDCLSEQQEWESAKITETIGKPLVEIATILQIEPSDLRAELGVLMQAYRNQRSA